MGMFSKKRIGLEFNEKDAEYTRQLLGTGSGVKSRKLIHLCGIKK